MPKKTTKTYKPTPKEAETLKKQFADDKKAGLTFKDAFANMNQDRPDEEKLTQSYAYSNLWPKGKQGATKQAATKKTANVGGAPKPSNAGRSEEEPSRSDSQESQYPVRRKASPRDVPQANARLAALLKKEGQLKGQLAKVQDELAAVSSEIEQLWQARSS